MPYKFRAVVDVGADVVDLEGEAFEKRRLLALEPCLGGPQTLKLEPEQKIDKGSEIKGADTRKREIY